MILSAIHNWDETSTTDNYVVNDMILSAIHNQR